MRCDHERSLGAGQSSQSFRQFPSPRGVERGGWFVHQENRWADRQGASNGHPLRFAARQFVRKRIGPGTHAKLLEQLTRNAFGVRLRLPEHMHRREPNVLQCREISKEVVKLEHHSDTAVQVTPRVASRDGSWCQRYPVDGDLPFANRIEPRDRAKHRRLSRARRATQNNNLALSRLE